MFKARLLNDNDYQQLLGWWKFWRFGAPPKECLPEDGRCGLMITKDGIDICAGFIYFTNSKIAWIEFIVSNPEYKAKDRQNAIEILITELSNIIRNRNCHIVFTSLKNENLINRFESCGFTKGSSGTTEMVLNVKAPD